MDTGICQVVVGLVNGSGCRNTGVVGLVDFVRFCGMRLSIVCFELQIELVVPSARCFV